MKITQDTVVTLRYQVTDAKGALIDPGKTPMVYLHGGYDNVFPKVEAALDGQETGFQIRIARRNCPPPCAWRAWTPSLNIPRRCALHGGGVGFRAQYFMAKR